MAQETLADRLTNYADVLVATSFLLMSGMGAAVGDPDIRCELTGAHIKVLSAVFLSGLIIIAGVRWLTQSANRLRSNTLPEPTPAEIYAQQIQDRLNLARYCLSVSFIVIACVLIVAAANSPLCETI